MGWFGKLTFGSLGMLLGGPLGAIAGAALGHHLLDKSGNMTGQAVSFGQKEQIQASYFVCIFSILGKLAKVDGTVTRDEIAVVEEFISHMKMGERERQFAKQIFNQAKQSEYSIDDLTTQFYQINKHQPTVLLSFMDVLFRLAAADGTLHPNEEALLKRIGQSFHVDDRQFDNLKAVYFKDVDKYFRILNCTPQNSNQEIKTSYKKLVKDFHPDTIVSKGLPDEFIRFATDRFQEIQGAYEAIRKERNI